MTDFISEHKKIIIGIILYITLFFISMYISPWQLSNVNANDLLWDTTSTVMDKIPVKIIFFGIYELCELMIYAQYGGFSSNNTVMFFFSACAIFSYVMIIKQIALNIYENGTALEFDFNFDFHLGDVESIILNFICDNVIIYIACLISFYIYTPVADWVNSVYTGGNFWIKTLVVISILFIVILPSLTHFLLFWAYYYAVIGIVNLIIYIDQLLSWHTAIKTVLFFIIAALLIIILNIIFNKLLDVLLHLLLPLLSAFFAGASDFIRESVRSLIVLCVGIIVLCVVVSLLALVLR